MTRARVQTPTSEGLWGSGFQSNTLWGAHAVDWEWNNSKGFQYFCLQNGSSKGQHLALTVLYVPYELDSGHPKATIPMAVTALVPEIFTTGGAVPASAYLRSFLPLLI